MSVQSDFLSYLKFEKRASPHTIVSYENDLTQFAAFIREEYDQTNLLSADFEIIRSWVIALLEENISPVSVNRKISTLKSLYKYAVKNSFIDVNPTEKLVSPKKQKRLPSFIEQKSMNSLWNTGVFDDSFKGQRDLLIIEILYQTGVRVSELLGLKETDISKSNKSIRVLGKRSKVREIPILPELVERVYLYLQMKRQNQIESEHLFVSEKGKQLSSRAVYSIVHTYLSKVTSNDKKSPHILRHTFATHMLNNGADLNIIKEILGHANLSATQVYTHNSFEQLKTIYKQAHPRA